MVFKLYKVLIKFMKNIVFIFFESDNCTYLTIYTILSQLNVIKNKFYL